MSSRIVSSTAPRSTLFSLLLGLLALGWPLAVHALLPRLGAWPLLMALVALAWWRLPAERRVWGWGLLIAGVAVLAAGHAELGVRAWPVLLNAAMLTAFAYSLARPPSAIERLARRREPGLGPRGVRYTRRVTQAWCVFFALNGSIALWTALYADLATWTLYNGGIVYALLAMMLGGEWGIRRQVRKTPDDE
ncbi:putative membrane protein [Chromohalobacter marismortui]|uniref:Putative membrane protein n=1 Tax=Chromohalobacter marismortui TaxID=42055 RepID=A0A4R7NMX4_9GAMM|nr:MULTISPECIES: hypothetical protein [Chromohalobacter]MCI0510232.1 hypothetical protein [Chromohalobacter sp.]MCI0593408.1 hypothetical protein [Chromohalobacter sp.]TDU21650.1 putative membrane protein [Chromohalobacter marismortui]